MLSAAVRTNAFFFYVSASAYSMFHHSKAQVTLPLAQWLG